MYVCVYVFVYVGTCLYVCLCQYARVVCECMPACMWVLCAQGRAEATPSPLGSASARSEDPCERRIAGLSCDVVAEQPGVCIGARASPQPLTNTVLELFTSPSL